MLFLHGIRALLHPPQKDHNLKINPWLDLNRSIITNPSPKRVSILTIVQEFGNKLHEAGDFFLFFYNIYEIKL